jgi:hypothetical protein
MTVCDPAPTNRVLQERIGLTRPVGRPPNEVRHSFTNFTHPAGTRMRPHRVTAKNEWHWGELYPCVGYTVTNTARPTANAVAFYNKRRTCELWMHKGRGVIRLTRLS